MLPTDSSRSRSSAASGNCFMNEAWVMAAALSKAPACFSSCSALNSFASLRSLKNVRRLPAQSSHLWIQRQVWQSMPLYFQEDLGARKCSHAPSSLVQTLRITSAGKAQNLLLSGLHSQKAEFNARWSWPLNHISVLGKSGKYPGKVGRKQRPRILHAPSACWTKL